MLSKRLVLIDPQRSYHNRTSRSARPYKTQLVHGSHPFYMGFDKEGGSFGIFYRTSAILGKQRVLPVTYSRVSFNIPHQLKLEICDTDKHQGHVCLTLTNTELWRILLVIDFFVSFSAFITCEVCSIGVVCRLWVATKNQASFRPLKRSLVAMMCTGS